MLRVIGSLPAVKFPKLTMTGVTETRPGRARRPDLDGGLLRDARRDSDRRVQEAFRSVAGHVMCSLYCSPDGRNLVFLAGRADSAFTYGCEVSAIVGLKLFSSDR